MGTSEINNLQPPWSMNRETPTKMKKESCRWNEKQGATNDGDAKRSSGDTDGISIPAFLQPLLGLDFMPYMPKEGGTAATNDEGLDKETTTTTRKDSDLLSDDILKDLDLLPTSSHSSSAALDNDLLVGRSDMSSPAFSDNTNEALEASAVLDARDERYEPVNTPGGDSVRKKRGIKTRLSALVKGRSSRRRANSTPLSKNVREELASPLSPSQALSPPSQTPPLRVPRKMSSSEVSYSWNESVDDGLDLDLPNRKIEFASPNDSVAWVKEQRKGLQSHISHLNSVQQQAKNMQTVTIQIHKRIGQVQNEMTQLQKALKKTEEKLHRELTNFDNAKSELAGLEASVIEASEAIILSIRQMQTPGIVSSSSASSPTIAIDDPSPLTPIAGNAAAEGRLPAVSSDQNFPVDMNQADFQLRPRAATEPAMSSSNSESFMRVHDLDLDTRPDNGSKDEASTLSSSTTSVVASGPANDFVFLDHNFTIIVQNLAKLGFSVAIDESDRFKPTGDTKRLLDKYESISFENNDTSIPEWPIQPWHAARGRDILVWTGRVPHSGFGCDWPVCKGRALMKISARGLLDYLRDSSRIKEYNKMSQGREDILVIQNGVETVAEDSPYGLPGDCRIIKSLNKPRLLPKAIEMMSLMYSKEMLQDAPGSYMIVSRSVFEDDSGEHKCTKTTMRSEMLLGVTLIRPVEESVCELTTINHVYAPGVPEYLAKKAAPSQASGMLRDLQNIFHKKK